MSFHRLPILLLIAISTLDNSSTALAQNLTEINSGAPINEVQSIELRPIRVSAQQYPLESKDENDPQPYQLDYEISYENETKAKGSLTLLPLSHFRITLEDIDGVDLPEVVIEHYTGGAHCCTNFIIYTWLNNQFKKTQSGLIDGSPKFVDLGNDGRQELLHRDSKFAYAFSAYVSSYPPTKIFALQNGDFHNVTRQYPDVLRTRLAELYQAFQDKQKNSSNNIGINGILASYVAQKILLGEFEEGWQLMLAHYDRNTADGLIIYRYDREIQEGGRTIYTNHEEIGRYPDFPTALREFLIRHGYLNRDGRPI